MSKFPEGNMFQLTQDEHDRLRSQNVTLKRGQYVKYLPYAFTEHGMIILEYLNQIEKAKEAELEQNKCPRIGFKP